MSRLPSVEELEDAAACAFLSPARWSAAPHDALADHAYEVREFRVSTRARVFTDGPERPPRVASGIDVTTRALVVRPVPRERFSGRVHIELLNPSTGQDFPMYWPDLADHLIRSGDAYVGVTCKQVTVEALRAIAPDRYDDLSMEHDGAVWDLLGAVGASLRDESDRLLPGLGRPEIVLATGWSQSGSFLRTYVSEGLHAMHTAELGHPPFDAFLIGVSSGGFGPMGYIPLDRHGEMRFDDDLMPVGDPLPQLPMTDARRVVRGSAVPVLELMSQDEAVHHVWHQRPDSDAPGDLYAQVLGDHRYRRTVTRAAELQLAHGGAPVYLYQLAWKTPVQDGLLRTPHTLCIPFAFANVDLATGITGTGADRYRLQDEMVGAWLAFARCGNPNHAGLPRWPGYDTVDRPTLVFDRDSRLVNDPLREERLALEPYPRYVPAVGEGRRTW